jgi:hypothetical protein
MRDSAELDITVTPAALAHGQSRLACGASGEGPDTGCGAQGMRPNASGRSVKTLNRSFYTAGADVRFEIRAIHSWCTSMRVMGRSSLSGSPRSVSSRYVCS